jgi:hypothetical protein
MGDVSQGEDFLMARFFWGLAVLGGFLFWALQTGDIAAQSKKKMTGPVVTINGVKSQTFDYFKEAKPSKPELYHFNFPPAPSDKIKEGPQMTIVPVTASADDVVDGLKKQFYVAEGKKLDATVKPVASAGLKGQSVDIYGTYLKKAKPDDTDDKATKVPRFRMLAAVVDVKGERYLIQLLGSSPTVGQIKPDFDEWLKNFK